MSIALPRAIQALAPIPSASTPLVVPRAAIWAPSQATAPTQTAARTPALSASPAPCPPGRGPARETVRATSDGRTNTVARRAGSKSGATIAERSPQGPAAICCPSPALVGEEIATTAPAAAAARHGPSTRAVATTDVAEVGASSLPSIAPTRARAMGAKKMSDATIAAGSGADRIAWSSRRPWHRANAL